MDPENQIYKLINIYKWMIGFPFSRMPFERRVIGIPSATGVSDMASYFNNIRHICRGIQLANFYQ
jgi:hypothetical protein